MIMKNKVLSIIMASLLIASSATMLTACKGDENTATPDTATIDEAYIEGTTFEILETVPVEVTDAVKDSDVKVTEDGKVVDKNGKELEKNEKGEIKIETSNGDTIYVKPDTVVDVVENNGVVRPTQPTTKPNNNNSNTQKPTTKPNNTKPTVKPTEPTTQKPTVKPTEPPTQKPTESKKTWHEAVYKDVYHPAVTKEVKHDAVTEKKWVETKAAYTYEEPIYETQLRMVCNDCGADLTGWSTSDIRNHCGNHALEGGKGSWGDKRIQVQVGTKTVEVPAEGYYKTVVVKEAWTETVVVKEAWTEKVLVREAGWY